MDKMMNKKGGISTYLNQATIYAVVVGIIFLIFTGSGGGVAISKAGQFASQVPGFVWIILAVIILFSAIGGKK